MSPRVIVIGAGWAGLSAARTYSLVNPTADITILDDDDSVGGVWSVSRIYPGLLADSPRGLFEYSDLSMLDEDSVSLDRPEKFGLIRGEEVHNYLHAYALKRDLLRRIRFRSRVIEAERLRHGANKAAGWRLTLSTGETLDCDKLVVASGLYSAPHVPDIQGLDAFAGLSMHSKLLGKQHHRLASPDIKSVFVVGGCKSATETVNLCLALPNKPQIHWIVRGNEYGVPILYNDPTLPISILSANNTRILSAFSPSIFDTESWFHQFFHSGRWWLGNWLYSKFWSLVAWSLMRDAEYDKSEQGRMIKPDVDKLFHALLHVSLIHKGNPVLEEIHKANRIKVHVGEIDHLSPSALFVRSKTSSETSSNLEEIPTDAILWCTGFKPSTTFFSPADAEDLGLPIAFSAQTPATQQRWRDLHAAADAENLATFPHLRPWPIHASKEPHTNYRMYRQIISPRTIAANDRSICFAGFISNSQTAFASEITALWGVAWMEGLLGRDRFGSEEEMEFDVAKTHAWMARRYGVRGVSGPEVVMEVQTYFDVLMKDLGLKAKRKGGWMEYFGIYGAGDYRTIVDELLEKERG
ncbi:FAD/NAD(P)-binding domain-containing protein [Polyplosphaeria fusca]|uniref:FAD/NAD(P)-binding domain-containing protein n=1 Tax=Polyplosphaeria fusca TaxID=682080 RepID=A0A9P4QMJ3_9PLEO|nr:FAD/NAD(P)-binding domain-containing protein [Polyplosphaeria fusca]